MLAVRILSTVVQDVVLGGRKVCGHEQKLSLGVLFPGEQRVHTRQGFTLGVSLLISFLPSGARLELLSIVLVEHVVIHLGLTVSRDFVLFRLVARVMLPRIWPCISAASLHFA